MARILLAEDEDSLREGIVLALEREGHEIVAVADGGLAAELLEGERLGFDLLLSDIKMPVMDGIALALLAAARHPGIPILLMTGFADQQARAHGLEALITAVLLKPFTGDQLRATVRAALGSAP